ncbi:integrin beta-1-like [Dicentrarchus labrax]|uniref:Integrin beta subunit tail domain-containing protein n=1 Tax=Dicentrarchus labrax TaxID=13489 RepID=A0A8C4GLZ1_DICLA|nr:integrin beta-1-like [Dicentrarchus labrax]
MAVKLLCLGLLLAQLGPSRAKQQTCLTSASNCDECMQSGPECAWCTAPHSNVRCHTLKGLQRAGCRKRYTYNSQGGVQVVRNDSSSEPVSPEAVFLQPQEFSLRLRPGVRQSFPLTITMPTGQHTAELAMDTTPVPAGVNVTFISSVNGNLLVVQVNVEAARCPSESDDSSQMQNRTGPWSVHITPRGFSQSVKLEITLECQCDCTRNREENSLGCSGRGALVCGQCECNKPYFGQQCQRDTDLFFSSNEDACRSGPNAPVCNGRGKCVEGFCECENRVNPTERYTGQFCECSNFDCPYHNDRICGGHGRCECGDCLCDDDWTGEDCSCSMETASCMANNQKLCNDRGMCQCGICVCEPPYTGPTCEDCPVCQGPCQQHAECVECRAFGTGAKKDRCDQECGYLIVTMVETKQDVPQTTAFCKMRSRDDSCVFYYTFSNLPSEGRSTVVRTKECRPN